MGSRRKAECIDSTYYSHPFKCSDCSLIYYDPQPTIPALRAFYSSTEQTSYANLLRGWTPQVLGDKEIEDCTRTLKELETFWLGGREGDLTTRSISFLEIGIGNAHMLAVARDALGWRVGGIELSEPLAEDARRSFGLSISQTDLSSLSAEFPDSGIHDIVFMSHVLEHTRHPGRVLENIAKLLRPGGIVVVHVPNGGSLQALHGWLDWPWSNYPEHLYFFTRESFEVSFKRVGMQCESFDSHSYETDEKAIAELLGRQIGRGAPLETKLFYEGLRESLLLPELRVVARKK